MKPRPPEGPHEALAKFFGEIAAGEGLAPASGVEIAASFEGVSKFTLYKALDPDAREEMPFTRVARLTSRYRARAAARYLAELCGCVLKPKPSAEMAESDEAALLKLAEESLGVVTVALSARADGVLDAAERRDVRQHLRRLIEVAVAFEDRLNEGGEA